MDSIWDMPKKSVLAGFAISIAAYGYASTNGSIIGCILFAFGLLAVVLYQLPLYTGKAGFVQDSYDAEDLFAVLFGNVIGCMLAALFLVGIMEVEQSEFIKQAIIARRGMDGIGALQILCKAIGCGFIMTTAVKFGMKSLEEKNAVYMLPLLFGVPLFLCCGFYHSIVDAFYLFYGAFSPFIQFGSTDLFMMSVVSWGIVVVGNLIGCNIQRLIMLDKSF